MNFTIYTNGNIDMIEALFNGIAALGTFWGGTADMGPHAGVNAIAFIELGAVGFLIGIVAAMVQTISRGGDKIEFGPIFLSLVLFLLLFVPRGTAVIESNANGDMRVVANVPYGALVPGWFISSMGQAITSGMETAFGMPTGTRLTDQGFGQTLQFYTELERPGAAQRIFGALDRANGGDQVDTFGSLRNYLTDCTLQKLELEKRHPDVIRRLELDKMAFPSASDETRLYLLSSGPSPQIVSCADAHAIITSKILNNFSNAEATMVINSLAGLSDTQVTAGKSGLTEMATNNAAVGLGIGVQDFFNQALLLPATIAARAEHEGRMGNVAGATALEMNYNQGRITQETAMIGKGFAWKEMASYFMAFAEVVFYGSMPILALFIAAGSLGLKVFLKFLILGVWINMWTPMLALVDFYIDYQANDLFAPLASSLGASGTLTLEGFSEATAAAQKALAAGYSFYPMIPILSLFLLTGSMMAATRVFDGGSQHAAGVGTAASLDPKKDAFGAQRNADGSYTARDPGMSAAAGFQSQRSVGSADGNAQAGVQLPTWTSNSSFQAATSQASQRTAEASQAYQGTVNQAYERAQSSGRGFELASNVGAAVQNSQSEGVSWVNSTATKVGSSHGLSTDKQQSLAGDIALGLGMGLDGAGVLAKVGGKYTAGMSDKDAQQFKQDLVQSIDDNLQNTSQSQLTNGLSGAITEGAKNTFTDSEGSRLTEQLAQTSSEVQKASLTESNLQSQGQGASTNQTLKAGELHSAEANRKLNNLETGLSGEDAERYESRKNALAAAMGPDGRGLDEDSANQYARATALSEINPVGFHNAFFGSDLPSEAPTDSRLAALMPENSDGIRTPDGTAGGATTPVTNNTEASRGFHEGRFQEAQTDAERAHEERSGEINSEGAAAQTKAVAGESLRMMEEAQDTFKTSDDWRQALSNADNLETPVYTTGDRIMGELESYKDQVADAYEQGGALAAVGKAITGAFGRETANAGVAASYESVQDWKDQTYQHHYDSTPETWTPEQRDLYASHATAKDARFASDITAPSETGQKFASFIGDPLGLNTLSQQFHHAAHEMNMRAGDAGVRVQQWAAQEGGPVPTPSEGGRAGTILTDEIKRSAVTETPSNLIETYNKANDSYRKLG